MDSMFLLALGSDAMPEIALCTHHAGDVLKSIYQSCTLGYALNSVETHHVYSLPVKQSVGNITSFYPIMQNVSAAGCVFSGNRNASTRARG